MVVQTGGRVDDVQGQCSARAQVRNELGGEREAMSLGNGHDGPGHPCARLGLGYIEVHHDGTRRTMRSMAQNRKAAPIRCIMSNTGPECDRTVHVGRTAWRSASASCVG